jgi:hypothetical protein
MNSYFHPYDPIPTLSSPFSWWSHPWLQNYSMKSILQKLSKVIIAPNDFIFLPKHDLQYPKISHIPLLPWQCVLMPPTLSFPCSCLHASIVTCIKLVLTVRGNFFYKWWPMGNCDDWYSRKKFLTKENHKKIASMSHLHAFLPMLYAHIPMLPFPCSCLDASIMTCLKLALTASGIRFLQMITVMIDVVEYWNHVLNFFWQQRQLTDDDKKTATKNCHTITSPRSVSMLTGDFLVMNIYREFNMA